MLDSVTDLRSMLKDPGLLPNKAYVAGQWIEAADGKTFAVTNPARGDVIANVPDLTRDDAKRAIAAADVARREWAGRTGKERAGVKFKDCDLIGYPLRVVVGPKAIEEGQIEIKVRKTGEVFTVARAEYLSKVQELLKEL